LETDKSAAQMPISSLFILHFGANTGYAIAPLEELFFDTGLELAGGDVGRVHFAYPNFDKGYPTNLPQGLKNLLKFDFKHPEREAINDLAKYVQAHEIRLVLAFDIQPIHAMFRPLRKSGVRAILAYWGAPISSRMPLWKLTIKRLQIALSRSKVDGLIFESQAMADLAEFGRGVPAEMIDVVPLGVDTTIFRPSRTDYVHEALGLPRDRKVVIYVGHMEKRKGVDSLIKSALELLADRRRSDVCFLIVGNRGEESKEYERMCHESGIEHLIHFAGYRNDLPQIYPGCFCGVIPSTGWDSFPRSSLEMAACGLPVIASRLQGLPEAVLDRQTGLLFEPGNVKELADCIATLLNDPELATKYGRQGRERCEDELNLSDHRRRLLEVFRKRLGIKSA